MPKDYFNHDHYQAVIKEKDARIYDLESALRAVMAVAEETRDDPEFTLATIRDTARVNLNLRPRAVKHPTPTASTDGNGICDDPTVPLDKW